MQKSMLRVFVYGTLKRGEPNHHWISNEQNGYAKFVGTAKTVKKYPLVIATKYNIPFLLNQPETGHRVHGEVYEIDSKMLQNLDDLEDHPSFYIRTEEDIEMDNSDSANNFNISKAWIYFLPKFRSSLLEQPMYSSYSAKGSHGLEYVAKYLRDSTFDYKNEVYDINENNN